MSGETEPLSLEALGWDAAFAEAFAPWGAAGLSPGRVAVQHRNRYAVYTEAGEVSAELAGKLRLGSGGLAELPAVGDWVAVAVRPGEAATTLHAVLPRRSAFSRKAAGREAVEQVLAANVDTVFLLAALTGDFSPRRLERYLVLARESAAAPVVVLTKTDLASDSAGAVREASRVAAGAPVHAVSGVTGEGVEGLRPYLVTGRTVALLGSSGVGKSTLLNRLLGREAVKTAAVRSRDGKGRHTTTRRELVLVPGGGLLLDTPGLRELSLWHAQEGVGGAFAEVEALARDCRFSDCGHNSEPGCAVRAAVQGGILPAQRLESFLKLRRELAWLEERVDPRAVAERKRLGKTAARRLRAHQKGR